MKSNQIEVAQGIGYIQSQPNQLVACLLLLILCVGWLVMLDRPILERYQCCMEREERIFEDYAKLLPMYVTSVSLILDKGKSLGGLQAAASFTFAECLLLYNTRLDCWCAKPVFCCAFSQFLKEPCSFSRRSVGDIPSSPSVATQSTFGTTQLSLVSKEETSNVTRWCDTVKGIARNRSLRLVVVTRIGPNQFCQYVVRN